MKPSVLHAHRDIVAAKHLLNTYPKCIALEKSSSKFPICNIFFLSEALKRRHICRTSERMPTQEKEMTDLLTSRKNRSRKKTPTKTTRQREWKEFERPLQDITKLYIIDFHIILSTADTHITSKFFFYLTSFPLSPQNITLPDALLHFYKAIVHFIHLREFNLLPCLIRG